MNLQTEIENWGEVQEFWCETANNIGATLKRRPISTLKNRRPDIQIFSFQFKIAIIYIYRCGKAQKIEPFPKKFNEG